MLVPPVHHFRRLADSETKKPLLFVKERRVSIRGVFKLDFVRVCTVVENRKLCYLAPALHCSYSGTLEREGFAWVFHHVQRRSQQALAQDRKGEH